MDNEVLYTNDMALLQYRCWQIAEDHGFHEERKQLPIKFRLLAEGALIMSEIAEFCEAARKKEIDAENLMEELADAVIRIFDTAASLPSELGTKELLTAINEKMAKNALRPYLHGKSA